MQIPRQTYNGIAAFCVATQFESIRIWIDPKFSDSVLLERKICDISRHRCFQSFAVLVSQMEYKQARK